MGLMTLLSAALVAVFVVLPKMVDDPAKEPVPGSALEPEVPTPLPATPVIDLTPTIPISGGLIRTVEEALHEGQAALDARDPEAAATAFRRASTLDPGNAVAATGLRRTEVLVEVRDMEISAVAHERRGENRAAADAARRALELDPQSEIARSVAGRLARRTATNTYHDFVTRGLAALEDQQYQRALDAFSAASELQPATPEVVDGLTRARAGILRQRVEKHLSRAADAEDSERWSAAVDEYQSVLTLEPTRAAGTDGLARSTRHLDLSQRMLAHLNHPERLATIEVLEEAAELADESRAVSPRGPRFTELIAQLDRLVEASSTPVPVALESDGLTKVMLYRVGELGTFDRHTLELRPGTYTVVGRRPGYRDVRLSIKVKPGQPPPKIVIRCTERI